MQTQNISSSSTDPLLPLVLDSLSGSSYDIARVVHAMFHASYASLKTTQNAWVRLVGGVWRPIENGVYGLLSRDVFEEYARREEHLEPPLRAQLRGVMRQLKTCLKKEAICKECRDLFYRPDLLAALDCDDDLVAFRNGVFRISTGELRPPSESDCISLMLNEDFDEDDPRLEDKLLGFQAYRKRVLARRRKATASGPLLQGEEGP
jgi:hypothetical protein